MKTYEKPELELVTFATESVAVLGYDEGENEEVEGD